MCLCRGKIYIWWWPCQMWNRHRGHQMGNSEYKKNIPTILKIFLKCKTDRELIWDWQCGNYMWFLNYKVLEKICQIHFPGYNIISFLFITTFEKNISGKTRITSFISWLKYDYYLKIILHEINATFTSISYFNINSVLTRTGPNDV